MTYEEAIFYVVAVVTVAGSLGVVLARNIVHSALSRGGYLHDVGKIGVPDTILLKPDRLSSAEFEVIKAHTITGDLLCGNLKLLRLVRPIVRSHHERLDGGDLHVGPLSASRSELSRAAA